MATNFEDFLHVVDSSMSLIRELQRRISHLADALRIDVEVLAAIEQAADELHHLGASAAAHTLPKDLTEEEWSSPEVAILRNRLDSVSLVAGQRPVDRRAWFRDLSLSCDEYAHAWTDFNLKVER